MFVSFLDLMQQCLETAHIFLTNPLPMLEIFNEVIEICQRSLMGVHPSKNTKIIIIIKNK